METWDAPHLEHVGAAPDAAVDKDGHLVTHSLDDVREHLDRTGRVVQLAAAVIAQHQAIDARFDRQLRVGGRQDALTDTIAIGFGVRTGSECEGSEVSVRIGLSGTG